MKEEGEETRIVVTSESDGGLLLEHCIHKDPIYRVEQGERLFPAAAAPNSLLFPPFTHTHIHTHTSTLTDTLITWQEPSTLEDYALSFQEQADCKSVWDRITPIAGVAEDEIAGKNT